MTRVITAALLASTLLLAGCSDPCTKLPPPSPAEREAAAAGAEIERERGSVECELDSGSNTWQQDS